ncbi:MAG: integrin, partial [Planctomycetes bacterium]|nr:integrin [Planctomycetota bacterium]
MNRVLFSLALSFPLTATPLAAQSILQQAYIKSSHPDASDQFGVSVAMSGNTAVVGVYNEDSNATGVNGNAANNSAADAGAVFVFVRSGSTWAQQAYLKPSNTDAGDRFGYSVGISGDTIVVGAYGEDSSATGVGGNQGDNSATDSGAAYVFTRSGSTWTQQAYLKASNTDTTDQFGLSVAISGDTILVGSFNEDSGNAADPNDDTLFNAGAAYVFTRSGTTWSQQAYLKPTTLGWNDRFGWHVTISGDTAVVSSSNEDSNATGVDGDATNDAASDAGAAWVFVRSGSTWSQQAFLKASNTDPSDNFGFAVAIDGDTIAVGAIGEDSAAVGVGGDQSDNSSSNSGAVYVFHRDGSTWSQQAYLKSDNCGQGDFFGDAVSCSGDTLLAGARYEDSSATGVGGDGANNAASSAGAAYVFQRCGEVWGELAYLKASNTGSSDFFGDVVCVDGTTALVTARTEDGGSPGINGPNN